MNRRMFLSSVTGIASLVAGCGRSAPDDEQGGGGDGQKSVTVELNEEVFSPNVAEVGVGGTVMWENNTDIDHRIKSHRYQPEAEEWEFPETPLEAGATVKHAFDSEGLYQYYSVTGGGQYSMCGAVSVGDAPESTSMC